MFSPEAEAEAETETENPESKMDKSMLGDLDSLPEEDKLRMSTMIDQLQIRDRLVLSLYIHTYNLVLPILSTSMLSVYILCYIFVVNSNLYLQVT